MCFRVHRVFADSSPPGSGEGSNQAPVSLPSPVLDVSQASFFSPIIPSGSLAFLTQRPVLRLQRTMVWMRRRGCCLRSLCAGAFSDGSHYWALRACFMSVGVGCPLPPPPLFEGGGGLWPSLDGGRNCGKLRRTEDLQYCRSSSGRKTVRRSPCAALATVAIAVAALRILFNSKHPSLPPHPPVSLPCLWRVSRVYCQKSREIVAARCLHRFERRRVTVMQLFRCV